MLEVISLIYKFDNTTHVVSENLSFEKAICDIIEKFHHGANLAIGIIQVDDVSTSIEIGKGEPGHPNADELGKLLNFYRVQLVNFKKDPEYHWGNANE